MQFQFIINRNDNNSNIFLQDNHFRNRNGYPLITVFFFLTNDIQTTIKLNIGLNKTNKIQK